MGKTPLTQKWVMLLSAYLYLLSLYLLKKFMEPRKENKLKWFSAFHNFFLSFFSGVTGIMILYEIFRHRDRFSSNSEWLRNLFALPVGTPMKGRVYWWCYIYGVTKWIELIDTWIILVRKAKKGITFLHVFHHSGMLTLPFLWFEAKFGAIWMPCMLNSFVHVIMYYYYGLASLGKRSRIRRYITLIQLIQFSLGLLYFLWFIPAKLFFRVDCSGNTPFMIFCCFLDGFFFYLFYDFYITEYRSSVAAKQLSQSSRQGQGDSLSLLEAGSAELEEKEITQSFEETPTLDTTQL
ncbi:putative Elongation of very long chain fatty acids protein F [Blattamonas nauphoetae]|uniref:Elongation of fatty acids protein n=1 Tax=Blattamonas nauphoetae TaxID=2049346 RepID=A0ABQ9X9U9_9EUKA|nr:putative Elongation of very long chain fatty acids protein F [Blattamonas nauphoetae]